MQAQGAPHSPGGTRGSRFNPIISTSVSVFPVMNSHWLVIRTRSCVRAVQHLTRKLSAALLSVQSILSTAGHCAGGGDAGVVP